ncbi:MAG: flagellar basal body-associated FliL family protein [Rhodobacteraceae bacterium]|nr:flagellar basal body-associated FliL family protein [Paracoccaceae bacterium]
MADEPSAETAEKPAKGSKKGLMMGLLGAILLGGGGFYATYSGMILGPKSESVASDGGHGGGESSGHGDPVMSGDLPDIMFIEMEPMVISLGDAAHSRYLRFSAQLDVEPAYAAEVNLVMPRILDVLNTYLRAVSEEELAKPSSFDRLRAQMLRRVQVVTGPGRVKDLLITEFILG